MSGSFCNAKKRSDLWLLERERDYCVYVHTNGVNGKKYVGMTKNVRRRWGNSGRGYRECPYFYRAIQKYGWETFDHDIVQDKLTQYEASELEIKLINEWETIGEKGYNLASGGNTAVTTTPEQRKIHSQYMSEKNRNPETNPLTNGKVVWGETHPHRHHARGVRIYLEALPELRRGLRGIQSGHPRRHAR